MGLFLSQARSGVLNFGLNLLRNWSNVTDAESSFRRNPRDTATSEAKVIEALWRNCGFTRLQPGVIRFIDVYQYAEAETMFTSHCRIEVSVFKLVQILQPLSRHLAVDKWLRRKDVRSAAAKHPMKALVWQAMSSLVDNDYIIVCFRGWRQ